MTDYRLSQLLDIKSIRRMADAHFHAAGIPIGIIDAFDDTVLAGSGWQDICVRFHRAHPVSRERCRESDNFIKAHLVQGEACHYRCKNGLRDIGIPIIVAGNHLATLFLGQFFYEDDIPDRIFFIRQAETFGFDHNAYLAALDRVPRFSRQKVDDILEYNKALAGFIADLGESSLREKRAEEELRRRERKYHAIFNQSYQFIALLSREGRVRQANETAHDYRGMAEAEHTGTPLWEADCWSCSPEQRETLRRGVAQAANGESVQFELSHSGIDGSLRHVDFSIKPITDQDGAIALLIAEGRDVSERKRMERELRLIQFAFDHNFDACFWINGRGEITAVNDAACRSLGYTREELLTMTVADIDPDWQGDERVLARKHLELRDRGTPILETRHRRKDGVIFPVEICNNFVESEGEWRNCAFARDITERKRMEDALRLSNLVVENSPVVLFRWRATPGWPVEMVSRNVSQFGYNREEFLSGALTYASIILPEDLERVTEETRAYSSSGAPHFHLEYRIITRDGQVRWVDERTVIERNNKGLIDFFQGVVIDITERKKMEEELVKSQKLESVGLLAGGIAHDFNNILTAILGNASLARQMIPTGERLHDHLNSIETAAFRAKDLTKQFLTFSKGGAPVMKPVNSAKLVETYARLSLSGLKSTCHLDIPDDLWNIEADEGQISQVINNLIINADQAMPQGGVIRVACENVRLDHGNPFSLAGGAYIRVSVTDQGMGIAPEHRGRVFDPYFSTKEEGRGLGLASAYAIMRKHSGHITVESRIGNGATFSFYLPAAPSAPRPPQPDTELPRPGSGRVLVMDDEELVRMVAGEMLEHLGYDVECARNGEEVLEVYAAAMTAGSPFDVVIMDLTIPGGMGGKETIQRLRELDPNVRAIVSSGYSDDPVMADCTGYGFRGMVAKPYDLEKLATEVHRVMERRGESR